jgi:hypothetical protein
MPLLSGAEMLARVDQLILNRAFPNWLKGFAAAIFNVSGRCDLAGRLIALKCILRLSYLGSTKAV